MNAQRARLNLDVDTRLARIWAQVWQVQSFDEMDARTRLVFAEALRAAYMEGYLDALREDNAGRRCELAVANGYATI